jgi:PDZ domain
MTRRIAICAAVLSVLLIGVSTRCARRTFAQQNAAPQPPAGAAIARFAHGGNAAEVPSDFSGGLIFLPVRINEGQPSLFELDSTAAVSSISPNRAMELGVANVSSPVLNLTGLFLSLPSLPENDKSDFEPEVGRPYQGTLGADLFARVVVELDYARQTVRLLDPAGYEYSGAGKTFHLAFDGGMPVVQAKLKVAGKTLEGNFIVNTALAEPVLVSSHVAEAHHLSVSHVKTVAIADDLDATAEASEGRLTEFQIGPFTVESALMEFSKGKMPGTGDAKVVGEIGGGMLRRFNLTFDYERQQIIFDPDSEFHADDNENMSGLSIIASGSNLKTFVVTQVRSGTPASEAGIQKGDEIAGVDEEPAADLSLVAVRDLFRQVGHSYKLLIERNGQAHTVTIRMRRLL